MVKKSIGIMQPSCLALSPGPYLLGGGGAWGQGYNHILIKACSSSYHITSGYLVIASPQDQYLPVIIITVEHATACRATTIK